MKKIWTTTKKKIGKKQLSIRSTIKQKDYFHYHDLIIGITVAPRTVPTINQCIQALRDIGYKDTIYIFAEPDKDNRCMKITSDKNIKILSNPIKLWCFGNYNNMCRSLIMVATRHQIPYIATLQDDFIMQPGSLEIIDDMINYPTDFGYANLHTRPRMEKYIYKNGRNNVNLGRWARGMAYMYSKQTLIDILAHPFYQSHLHTYTKNQQIDSCVSYVLQLLWKSQLYHNPSLSSHIGDSIIWHTDNIKWLILDQKFTKRVAGIASIPNREENLKVTISSIYHQVDEIHVYLNGYDHVPDFLKGSKITTHFDFSSGSGDNGDAGKFHTYEKQEDAYYFCMDDDLYYAPDYCNTMIEWIEKYDRKAVVGLHGVVMKDIQSWILSYYKDRYVFHFAKNVPTPICVQILGTGVCAMHTSALKITRKDFVHPNMGDIFVGIAAQKQQVPMVCISRDHQMVKQQTVNTTIFNDQKLDDSIQTRLVNENNRKTIWIEQPLKK